MTEGAWITLAVATGGTFGTIITALIKSPFKKNGDNKIPNSAICPAHSGLVAEISSLQSGMTRIEKSQGDIWDGIGEIRNDVKELISRVKNDEG